MDDVIESIERMNLDYNSTPYQLFGPSTPSYKVPQKWIINTLEIVHLDEVGKTKNRIYTRQYGGDVDSLDASGVDDMDVSYDSYLNLSTNF